MTVINGVDTSTIDYDALGRYLQAQAYAQSGGIAPPDPTEIAAWGNQRRQIADQYGNSQAQFAYQRSTQQAQQGQDTADLAKQWDRTRTALPGQFAHRGLLDSGVYGGALQQYGSDRDSASKNLALKYQNSLGQIGLNQQQSQSAYTSGNQQVDASEAARRQSLAAQLKGVV